MLHHIERHATARTLSPRPLPSAGRSVIENVSRRGFLAGTAGFAIALQVIPADAYEAYKHGGQSMPNGVINDPHVFVAIARDGTVTVVAHRSEMGSGSRTL